MIPRTLIFCQLQFRILSEPIDLVKNGYSQFRRLVQIMAEFDYETHLFTDDWSAGVRLSLKSLGAGIAQDRQR